MNKDLITEGTNELSELKDFENEILSLEKMTTTFKSFFN